MSQNNAIQCISNEENENLDGFDLGRVFLFGIASIPPKYEVGLWVAILTSSLDFRRKLLQFPHFFILVPTTKVLT